MNQRLLSLDTLRGFDMLFIMGGDAFFLCLGALLPGTIFADFAQQMGHKAWDGFALYDLIFPLFLFIAGVSFPFSLAKSRSVGESEQKTMLRILRRGLTLVVLGIVYNGLLSFDFENLRVASVLGRIGLAWMLAAFIYALLTQGKRNHCLGDFVGILRPAHLGQCARCARCFIAFYGGEYRRVC